VPPFPQHIPTTAVSPTPNTPHVFSDDAALLSPSCGGFAEGASASLPGKITKKRKSVALIDDDDFDHIGTPVPVAIDTDVEMSEAEAVVSPEPERQRTIKRVKSDASRRLKRTGSRLSRKVSRQSITDEKADKVVVVKPGGAVPPVPAVPQGVEGKKVKVVGDDGYGGLGHEIF
jgi:hypothetical protein